MIELSAKTHYLKTHTDTELVALREALAKPEVKEALVYAMADMAEEGFPTEYLIGARLFRARLLNLAEPLHPQVYLGFEFE